MQVDPSVLGISFAEWLSLTGEYSKKWKRCVAASLVRHPRCMIWPSECKAAKSRSWPLQHLRVASAFQRASRFNLPAATACGIGWSLGFLGKTQLLLDVLNLQQRHVREQLMT